LVYGHTDGRVAVVPQHGTVERGTLASIIRRAGLTSAEFLDLLK
jgi:predicted RNA binding protein YcfA (HicA-like mRNA interferase family)